MRARLIPTRLIPLLITLALGPTGCDASKAPGGSGQGAADPAAARAAIDAANARFRDAMTRGDAAGAAANYAEDAMIMMSNEAAWQGRAGITAGLGGMLGQMTVKEFSNKTTDVMVSQDLAVETGTFGWTLQPKEGKEITDKGKYVTVWRRQADGEWKIVRDINNSDLPVPK